MSRTRRDQDRSVNPVKVWLNWQGGEGKDNFFTFWDKTKKEEIPIKKLEFLYLDHLHSVTGFDSKKKQGISGTIVRNTKTQPIKTWKGGADYKVGLYADLKVDNSIKYQAKIYVGVVDRKNKRLIPAVLNLSGSSWSSWLNMMKGEENYSEQGGRFETAYGTLYDQIFSVNEVRECKNGSTTYFEPVYSVVELVGDKDAAWLSDEADSLDKLIQSYLDSSVGRSTKKEDQEPEMNEPESETPGDQSAEGVVGDDHQDVDDVEDLPF